MTYVGAVRAALAATGDPERAVQQQAYMKSDLPYVGLSAPELRALLKPILAEHRFVDRGSWEAAALELWEGNRSMEEYARDVFPVEEAANGLTWMEEVETPRREVELDLHNAINC